MAQVMRPSDVENAATPHNRGYFSLHVLFNPFPTADQGPGPGTQRAGDPMGTVIYCAGLQRGNRGFPLA